jgi:hypothetical protein
MGRYNNLYLIITPPYFKEIGSPLFSYKGMQRHSRSLLLLGIEISGRKKAILSSVVFLPCD